MVWEARMNNLEKNSSCNEPTRVQGKTWWWISWVPFVGAKIRNLSPFFRKLASGAWPPQPSHFPHYLIVVLASIAGWQARTEVTTIAPFQTPKADLPFNGDTVADALRDSFKSLYDEVTTESQDQRQKHSDADISVLRGLNSPSFKTTQDASRFAVDVKGLSYEKIVSSARAMRHTEKLISGDVILINNAAQFILVARTSESGPWQSIPSPTTAEGLKQATRSLAERILEAEDPTVAGAALLKDGQVDQALTILYRAWTLNPRDVTTNLNLCMGYDASHRYLNEINCYKALLDLKPLFPKAMPKEKVRDRLAHAEYLYGDGGYQTKAIADFNDLAHNQGYTDALLELGNALNDNGDHNGAVNAYDEFIKIQSPCDEHGNRKLAVAHLNKGTVLAQQNKHNEAMAEYTNALSCAPGDLPVLISLAVETANGGDVDGGIAQLESLIQENQNQESIATACLQLGVLFEEKKNDWRAATEQYRNALELSPHYDEAHHRLASSLIHEGLPGYALSEYIKIAKLSHLERDRRYALVLAHKWLGDALTRQGKYPAAAAAYRDTIQLKHDYRAAHSELGFVLEKQGHLDEAIEHYRVAAQPDSRELDDEFTSQAARTRLAEALVSQRRTHRLEAIAELRRVTELDLKNLECRFCLAKALLDEGHFVDAAAEYRWAISMEPQSAAAHNGLGLALDKQGLVDQALTEYRQAVNLDPSNAIYHANLARALNLQHLNQEAAAERQMVAKLNVPGVVARDHAQQYVPCQHLP
jgi:tetratricopeptide (TPR) repeat protein